MPSEHATDPRTVLVRDKYFTLRPKPLERWIWKQGLPQAAERVFWLHWEQGMRRGDWCSELALREVARECCVDVSTVTRAYQLLVRLGLVARQDPGRDASRPFQQAIAITEVRVPRELVVDLGRAPNRVRAAEAGRELGASGEAQGSGGRETTRPAALSLGLSRAESAALMKKLSDGERAEFYKASRDRRTSMRFDEPSGLTAEERGRVLEVLGRISGARPEPTAAPVGHVKGAAIPPVARKLSPLEVARTRRELLKMVGPEECGEVLRQVIWSVEEGALRRFERPMAINIALKKVREGLWTRPNRMPPRWLVSARAETCVGA